MDKKEALQGICEGIGYEFQNIALLENALVHSSFAYESGGAVKSNERAEFLGDAVLDTIISDYLFRSLINYEEGDLTKIRAAIVCERSLADVAKEIQLGQALELGVSAERTGVRKRISVLADAMEAVIGAVYLDAGYDKTRRVVLELFKETTSKAITGKLDNDFKSQFQSRMQVSGEVDIQYILEREEGPDHDKTFFIELRVEDQAYGRGCGKSKKEAEQQAAQAALRGLRRRS